MLDIKIKRHFLAQVELWYADGCPNFTYLSTAADLVAERSLVEDEALGHVQHLVSINSWPYQEPCP